MYVYVSLLVRMTRFQKYKAQEVKIFIFEFTTSCSRPETIFVFRFYPKLSPRTPVLN